MNDQDPYEPLQAPVDDEPRSNPGSVGLGIFLAVLIWVIGGILCSMIPFLGCLGGLLAVIAGPVAALIAQAKGKSKTAKGLWIGFALILGILLLLLGILIATCGGMKF